MAKHKSQQERAASPFMDRTDSVLNLTKSSLYGIYNTSSVSLNRENEEVEEYIEGSELHIPSRRASLAGIVPVSPKLNGSVEPAWDLARVAIVAVAAFAYNEVTRNIHTTHIDGSAAAINSYLVRFVDNCKPFQTFVQKHDLGVADRIVTLALEGLLLSSIVPVLDNVMPLGCTKRLLSSNPNPYHRGNLVNDLVRSLITFLGISYAVRHLEWSLPLQMAMAWSLINPVLWLLLDGTANGFMGSTAVAFGATGAIYLQNAASFTSDHDLLTIFLFVGSFFFCGVIIFGKLGRVLFGSR